MTTKRQGLDPCPTALSLAEQKHVQDRMQAGASPRMGVIRKMLRLCPKQAEEGK
jgi:hypothetical protein